MGWDRTKQFSAVALRARAAVRSRFKLDTRSLAVFRIALAILVVVDLVLRARNVELFYTEQGVVPQSLALAAPPVDVPSIYFLSSEPWVTVALFSIHALLGCLLFVGYRTRLSTVLVAVFVVSLDLRNPLVLSYADTLFMWLLFWAIFLPLGERWSVDAVHAEREPRASVSGLPAALILLQVITVYFVNGLYKTGSELWASGEAAVLVMELDDMTFLAAELVASQPALLELGGRIWYAMLLGSWLLVVLHGRARTLLVALFVLTHLSFAVTVRIGAFAFVSIAGVLLFFQGSFWTDLRTVVNRLGGDDWVSTLAQRAEYVADRVPRAPEFGSVQYLRRYRRPLVVGVAVGIAALVVISLLSAGGVVETDTAADIEAGTTTVIAHQTEWSIFAPEPRTTARQYVIAAESTAGDQRDLLTDRELTSERPTELQTQFETYRERFYLSSVRQDEPEGTQQLFVDHYCETAAIDGEPISHLTLYVIEESVTTETAQTPVDRERSVRKLGSYGCDGEGHRVDLPKA